MKKILVIVVLGLLLVSCSDYKTKKLLENCADFKWEESTGLDINNAFPKLKNKLKNSGYEQDFKACELEMKLSPITFKEKYK